MGDGGLVVQRLNPVGALPAKLLGDSLSFKVIKESHASTHASDHVPSVSY